MKEFIVIANAPETIKCFEDHNEPELVRCKNCKHYGYYGLSVETVSECRIDHCENPDADWFCADGKRNGGEQE